MRCRSKNLLRSAESPWVGAAPAAPQCRSRLEIEIQRDAEAQAGPRLNARFDPDQSYRPLTAEGTGRVGPRLILTETGSPSSFVNRREMTDRHSDSSAATGRWTKNHCFSRRSPLKGRLRILGQFVKGDGQMAVLRALVASGHFHPNRPYPRMAADPVGHPF